jgi:hypothetical protein
MPSGISLALIPNACVMGYGMEHYHLHDAALYNILNDLRETYALEGAEMPYTVEDYRREVARELLKRMSPHERLDGLSLEEVQAYLDERRRQADARRDQGQQD